VRYEGEVRVRWSWGELTAVREALEVTPLFAGRDELRAKLRRRPVHGKGVVLDVVLAEHLAANLVALDLPTAVAKSSLLRALQARERERRAAAAAADADAAAAEAA
jgi:hypothetical protein